MSEITKKYIMKQELLAESFHVPIEHLSVFQNILYKLNTQKIIENDRLGLATKDKKEPALEYSSTRNPFFESARLLRMKCKIESQYSQKFFDQTCLGKKTFELGHYFNEQGIFFNCSLKLIINLANTNFEIGHEFYSLQAFDGYKTDCEFQCLPRISLCCVNDICIAYLFEDTNGKLIHNIPTLMI
jgi:hypothetical protein